MDQINVELIKYSPEIVYEKIADIYNNIVATEKHPNEITHGILRALQKPGKPKGPKRIKYSTNNSFIRSQKNISSQYNEKNQFKSRPAIPISQAAYRKNRSTTEHVFGIKLIIERTMPSAPSRHEQSIQ